MPLSNVNQELVNRAKANIQLNADELLGALGHVPDDKLNWAPSESTRSPLQIAAHCGVGNNLFAQYLRGENPGQGMDPKDVFRRIKLAELQVKTRNECIEHVQASVKGLFDALDLLTDEEIESDSQTPFGPRPMRFWISYPASHMLGHTYQINYLQCMWGDSDMHSRPIIV